MRVARFDVIASSDLSLPTASKSVNTTCQGFSAAERGVSSVVIGCSGLACVGCAGTWRMISGIRLVLLT